MSTSPPPSRPAGLVRPVLLLVLASLLVRLLVTREASLFVGPLVQGLLWPAAALLSWAGAWQLADGLRGRRLPAGPGRIVAALLLPVLVVAVVGPRSLGTWTAQRQLGESPSLVASGSTRHEDFGPLPAGTVTLSVYEYARRSTLDGGRTVAGRRVVTEGFVTRGAGSGRAGWGVARLKVFCCAADALPFVAGVEEGPAEVPAEGTWVRVVAEHRPAVGGASRLRVLQLTPIAVPKEPYLW